MNITGSCSLFVLVLTMGLLATGCGNSQSPQGKIDSLAKQMQSQLPKKLDSNTKLVKVYTKKMELVSEYELLLKPTNEKEDAVLAKKLGAYLHSTVCTNIKNDLLNRGISSQYIYTNTQGKVILEMVLAPGDC